MLHIIGGELIYDQIGPNNYKITLKVYRDCSPDVTTKLDGTQNMPLAFVTIFDVNGVFVKQLNLGVPTINLIPGSITNPCVLIKHPCVEEGIYVTTTTLTPQVGGYTLVYQRCCRNAGVDNLINSGTQGSSYTAFIPGPELAATNSSPRFTNFPPIDICNNMALVFDHAATDADGDILVYSFNRPLDGLDQCCPSLTAYTNACVPSLICPTIPQPPPYQFVNYAGAFNQNYPVASNPSLTINSSSGLLQGKPNLSGLFVVGICVEEWRNNVLLSKHYRDFQFTVKVCTVSVVAAIADQSQNCIGQTITFTNTSLSQSNNPNYFWNFGDPTTLGDTSLANSPSYTYQDTGIYYATLIVNRGGLCTDTVKKTIYVYPVLNINFSKPNTYYVKSNSVNFSTAGVFLANNTTYDWSFPSASPPTSTLQNPTGIQFTSAGLFSVTLIAKQFACRDTFIDSIRVLNRPVAKINNFPTQLCDPGKISFSNGALVNIRQVIGGKQVMGPGILLMNLHIHFLPQEFTAFP
ncbi:MAG: PKD domain-containing protein [Sphingobacteriaceae bacterium]|nr:PKD domain-containing protein [Sphingobacteriaceae bacterium]